MPFSISSLLLRLRGSRESGFSLVEVTLALGVCSFCLLTVVGLLPVGLSTLRQAMDQTVESQIVQHLNSKILLTPFSQLNNKYGTSTFYFDNEGSVSSSTPTAGYRAKTSLEDVVFPGSTNISTNSPLARSLLTIRVEIVRLPVATTTNRFNLAVANFGN